jgi:drug/metabolite transporter (DMT)-like permease
VRYFLVLAAVNLMWAFQFSGIKFATETLGPITVVLTTLGLSALLLWPFVAFERRPTTDAPDGSWRLRLVLLGCGAVVSQLGMTWGVQRSLASNAAVLNLTIPVITAIFASLLLRERMTKLRWAAFALALAGSAIVPGMDWRGAQFGESRFAIGNLLIVAGCCGSSYYNTYSKVLLRRYGPIEVTVYSFAAACAVLAPLALWIEAPSAARFALLGWRGWGSLLGIAVFSLALSMVLFLWVIDRIDVTQASVSIYMIPVFGVVMSAVMLSEPVTWRLIAAGAFVCASTFLVTIYEEKQKSARARKDTASAVA